MQVKIPFLSGAVMGIVLLIAMPPVISGAQYTEQVVGVVKAIDSKTVTIETSEQQSLLIHVSGKTRVLRSNTPSSLQQLKVGDRVVVDGLKDKAGTLKAQQLAWEPDPVKNISFQVTTLPQHLFAVQMPDAITGAGPVTMQEASGPEIDLPEGSVYLLVSVFHPAIPGGAIGGKDFYLIDGSGKINSGLHKMGRGWAGNDGFRTGFGGPGLTEFLFVVPRNRVSDSVFRFMGTEVKVTTAAD